jgi:cytidylate kinase
MKCNAERLIEAIIAVEVMKHQQQQAAKKAAASRPQPVVVTVSRDYGSMGKEIGQLLADTLEVRCCDRYILQEVARRAHVDEKLVSALDEHARHFADQLWQKLLHRDTMDYETYYKYLVKTIVSIAVGGGVIIGRGANFILGSDRAFRVRITGSDEKCAERIAEREQLDLQASLERVHEVNRERAEYIQMLYQRDINDHSAYDLVLNSDRYTKAQCVELILDAMEKAGYKLPKDARDSIQVHSSE